MSGAFITVEGGEGAGKTTQIARLADWLRAAGKTVVQTREPGGSAAAERIRALVLDPDLSGWTPASEALLMTAARCDHVDKVIAPARRRGEWVLCDRFTDSTRAYQGVMQGLGLSAIDQLEAMFLTDCRPDLTLVLDIDPDEGLDRMRARPDAETRYDRMDLAAHRAIREAFLSIAAADPKRCVVLDASQDEERVAESVRAAVAARFMVTADG